MYEWKVIIHVWPYFMQDKLIGDRRVTHYVKADTIKEALEKADLIVVGIKHNPAVHQAPIFHLEKVSV